MERILHIFDMYFIFYFIFWVDATSSALWKTCVDVQLQPVTHASSSVGTLIKSCATRQQLLPNRYTDIFALHSDRLATPLCYSAEILNTKNRTKQNKKNPLEHRGLAWSFFFYIVSQHGPWESFWMFKNFFNLIFHFIKCSVTNMLQSSVSNPSLPAFLY